MGNSDSLDVAMVRVQRAIYLRGLFLTRYAAAEMALSHLLVAAKEHPHYASIPILPFKFERVKSAVRSLIALDGPISKFADDIERGVQLLEAFQSHRDLIAHGLFQLPSPQYPDRVGFRMYRKRGNDVEFCVVEWTMALFEELVAQTAQLTPALLGTISAIFNDLKLGELPDTASLYETP